MWAGRLGIGTLSCLDGYMNIALEQTEEYVNGVKTNEYGDAFVRGNNGAFGFSSLVSRERTDERLDCSVVYQQTRIGRPFSSFRKATNVD